MDERDWESLDGMPAYGWMCLRCRQGGAPCDGGVCAACRDLSRSESHRRLYRAVQALYERPARTGMAGPDRN